MKLKKGQKVVIARAATDNINWCGSLMKYVNDGVVYEIAAAEADGTHMIFTEGGDDYWYFPEECLELTVGDDEVDAEVVRCLLDKIEIKTSYRRDGIDYTDRNMLIHDIISEAYSKYCSDNLEDVERDLDKLIEDLNGVKELCKKLK